MMHLLLAWSTGKIGRRCAKEVTPWCCTMEVSHYVYREKCVVPENTDNGVDMWYVGFR